MLGPANHFFDSLPDSWKITLSLKIFLNFVVK